MDYHSQDLTFERYFEPIKLCSVTRPDDVRLNSSIGENLQELLRLATDIHNGPAEPHLERLRTFFARMNTGNNIKNALAYGSKNERGNNEFSQQFDYIDREIRDRVKRFGKRDTRYATVLQIWEENKGRIPEKSALVLQNFDHVIQALQTAQETGNGPDVLKRNLVRAQTNRAVFEKALKGRSSSATVQAWQAAAAQPVPIWRKLFSVFTSAAPAPAPRAPHAPADHTARASEPRVAL